MHSFHVHKQDKTCGRWEEIWSQYLLAYVHTYAPVYAPSPSRCSVYGHVFVRADVHKYSYCLAWHAKLRTFYITSWKGNGYSSRLSYYYKQKGPSEPYASKLWPGENMNCRSAYLNKHVQSFTNTCNKNDFIPSAFLQYYNIFLKCVSRSDRLCGLVVRVAGYRSRGPSSIPGATRYSEK
jgi:hypothetical protein